MRLAIAVASGLFVAGLITVVVVLVLWRPWRHKSVATLSDTSSTPRASSSSTSASSSIALLDASAKADADTVSNSAADAGATAALNRKLNVILITIDTLRSDLGYAGYARPVTPNLDALAAKSTVFERAYATAPYTMKALVALLTGRFTSEALRDYQHYTKYFPPNVFLAERVKASGARTVAVMCHRYFALRPGFEQGFDVYDVSAMPPGMTDSDPRPTSEGLTDVALRLLARSENSPAADGGRKLFAWIHYFDPHSPYVNHAGAPTFGSMESTSLNRSRDVYDEEVWFTDKHVGRLLDFIAKSPWAEDTAIIVTADHGEAFGEKGHYRHGRELWEPLVRVPLILFLPGSLHVEPRRISVKRSHIDVVPTILELMGIAEEAPTLRGKSLLADVFAPVGEGGGSALDERDVFMDVPEGEMNKPRSAIITGKTPGMKLIKREQHNELYDLSSDPDEATDLSSDASRLAEARARYDAFVATLEQQKAVGH